jgi:hypothetical protein
MTKVTEKTRRVKMIGAAIILAVVIGVGMAPAVTGAQTAVVSQEAAEAQAEARARENDVRRMYEDARFAYALAPTAWTSGSEGAQVPQDIRIMQRIVETALREVEAPELPAALREAGEAEESPGAFVYNPGDTEPVIMVGELGLRRGRSWSIGGRDVTGFYMEGYGYLFTVKWRVSPRGNHFTSWDRAEDRYLELAALAEHARQAAEVSDEAEARAAGEAEQALQRERDEFEEQQEAWEEWADDYRNSLAETLREVVAQYGSTLKRATPDEAITFIADFGGDEDATVTVSTLRGQLTGASREENLAAVNLATGETGVTDTLRTELKIMSEIIDSSLQGEGSDDTWSYAVNFGEVRYFGGESSFQYVPGYGVLFHKGARLNTATQLIRGATRARRGTGVDVETFREQLEEGTEVQREAYTEHLADLKAKTAEILATYGPTLTGLDDSDWVGVFYNVGSGAGLLEGGISNYLVQAMMMDVRQAGVQADGASWLLDRLVTNEKQE